MIVNKQVTVPVIGLHVRISLIYTTLDLLYARSVALSSAPPLFSSAVSLALAIPSLLIVTSKAGRTCLILSEDRTSSYVRFGMHK